MLSLSDVAATKLQELFNRMDEPRPRLRVFMDHRCHCGAAHFSLALDPDEGSVDTAFELKGVSFIADSDVSKELDAIEIDYIEDLMRQGFTISNREHQCGGHM